MKGCLSFGILVLLLSAGVVYGFGLSLPEAHSVSRTAVIDAPVDSVWAAVTTPMAFSEWRPDVSDVTLLQPVDGRPTWRETASGETLTFEVVRARAPRVLVTRIADEGLPFGGSWTYRLEPRGEGTTVEITEDGRIYSPVFRFVSQFLLGYDGSITAYLDALVSRFGGRLEPAEGPVAPIPDDSLAMPGGAR